MAKSIVIVGGGSSGWMTAAYLRKALSGVDVTVVEAPHIKTIGVGEATFSTIKLFFDFLGLEEHEWMPSCNATYKLAIKFANWTKAGGHFYHPFQRYEMVDGYNMGEWWLKLKRGEEAFDYSCFTIPALCDNKRSPRYLDGRVFDDKVQAFFSDGERVPNAFLSDHQVQYPYAYHFDAGLLANFLEGYATKRGVRKIEDEVVQVELREDGGISHLVTKEHGTLAADLFVDCTGFRGLLINKALQEPFISFNDSLLNDSAVAMQVPVDIAHARHQSLHDRDGPERRLGVGHSALRPRRDRLRLLQPVHLQGAKRKPSSANTSDRRPTPARPTTSRCGSGATATPG